MRYLLLTYYKKPSGKIDESMSLSRNLRTRDLQNANVILDFQDHRVLKASVGGQTATRDWDTIVSYYYQYYASTIERLFQENGHKLPDTVEDTT